MFRLSSRRSYTYNQSNESLLKKFMTSKFPSTLILMELAEELTAKRCELKLHWLKRDDNQLADDLIIENFDAFDDEPLTGGDIKWRILDKLMKGAEGFHQELKARRGEKRAKPARFRTQRGSRKGSWPPGSPVGFAREITIRNG